ncbi:MAG TPA: hypothetical protein VFU00_08585 [Gemmatimonadales bacterium]|nr:hypothetical protein [Gemmatimonadales bacterium]
MSARLALAVAGLLAMTAAALAAQAPIRDNSFLVEEAYNQERGVVQHIGTLDHGGAGEWEAAVTQEWSVGGIRHQVGFTLPFPDAGSGAGLGDIGLNYRLQLVGHPEARLLLAPRATLLLPTGSAVRGRGAGGIGVEVNLPLTYVAAPRLVTHWNAGFTHHPAASVAGGGSASTTSVGLGASAVWLLRPTVNLLLEGIWSSDAEAIADGVAARSESAFVSPGIRWALNAGSVQVVPGLGWAIGVGPSRGEESLFVYLSVEHPFMK